MKNNTVEMTLAAATALNEAVREAGINTADIRGRTVCAEDGCYIVGFVSDGMRYEYYVDAATGDIPGFVSAPICVDDEKPSHKNEKLSTFVA